MAMAVALYGAAVAAPSCLPLGSSSSSWRSGRQRQDWRPARRACLRGWAEPDAFVAGLVACAASLASRPQRRLGAAAARRAADGMRDVLLDTKDEDASEESASYLQSQDDDEQVALEKAPPKAELSPAERKKGRLRNADLIEPELPPGVSPYAPGEGYGSNAIPFVGIAPKTSKRRNASNRIEAIKLIERAREIAKTKKKEMDERDQRKRVPTQVLPVPEERFAELREKGWLDALRAEGLEVEEQEEEGKAHDTRWVSLRVSGSSEDDVRAGVLRIMSALVPRRLGSARSLSS
eukprot:TRINITY_DN108927_c0_g1_i1.p1 TRINITY_DN108927_c0_g1~~TRINITY_DN108927_c0_g1_i1.p1  ORF type:complete len:293 (+),score=68.32 TRINITY_DN108927_c0_g1_i1:41-919(+)